MLTAHLSDGSSVNLRSIISDDEIVLLKQKSPFYCPGCKKQMHLRAGKRRRPHFAHLQGSNCTAYSDSETDLHMAGKIHLFEWLSRQKIAAEVEKYLPNIVQIPDLYTEDYHGLQIAIEFQCSTIPEDRFTTRTKGFQSSGITPIWILSSSRIKEVSPYIYELRSMDWMAVTANALHDKQIKLTTFDPYSNLFHQFTSITPLSLTRMFALKQTFSTNIMKLENLLPLKTTYQANVAYLSTIWKRTKHNWRHYSFKLKSRAINYIKAIYYKQHHHLSLFPSEAGIPTRYLHFIQTPAFIWQAWVLEFIRNRGYGQMFTFKELLQAFRLMVKKNIFQLRILPLLHHSHFSFAIMDYLLSLQFIGILNRKSSTLFVIVREVRYPKTIEEASKNDEKIHAYIKDFLKDGKNSM